MTFVNPPAAGGSGGGISLEDIPADAAANVAALRSLGQGSLQALSKAIADQLYAAAGSGGGGSSAAARRASALWQRRTFKLTRLSSTPMVSGTNAVGQSVYWFSPMRVAEKLSSPLDAYYAWESTDHDGLFTTPGTGGIFLRTAPSPAGPWSTRSMVFTDTDYAGEAETPSVIYVPDDPNGRPFYCYYQESTGILQFTRLRTSADGRTGWVQEPLRNVMAPKADWSTKRLRMPANSDALNREHTGYFNPQMIGNRWIAYSRANAIAPHAFAMWHSQNGIDWQSDPRELRYATDLTRDPNKWLAWTQMHLIRWDGQLYGICTQILGLDRSPVIVPMSEDCRTPIGPPAPLLPASLQSWEAASYVRSIRPFVDIDGTVYVYITYADNATSTQTTHGLYTGCYRLGVIE